MEIGKVKPASHIDEGAVEWRVPVQVFMLPSARKLEVKSIYEDEGFLCIDVEETEAVDGIGG